MSIAAGEGWNYAVFRVLWAVLLSITTLYLVLIRVSGVSAPIIDFYIELIPIVWVYFGLSWGYYLLRGRSIAPFGDYDPETYPLQRWFGFEGSFFASIILGIAAFFYFGNLVTTQQQIIFPVNKVFETGWSGGSGTSFQIISNLSYSIATGGTAFLFAMAHSLPATVVENPLLLFLPLTAILLLTRLILEGFMGVEPSIVGIIALAIWIVTVPLVFSFVGHAPGAYGGDETAYVRAADYSFYVSIPVALFGFPIVADVGHFSNNYHAAIAETQGRQTIYGGSPINMRNGGTPSG